MTLFLKIPVGRDQMLKFKDIARHHSRLQAMKHFTAHARAFFTALQGHKKILWIRHSNFLDPEKDLPRQM